MDHKIGFDNLQLVTPQLFYQQDWGAQWLSGRMPDLRLRGRGVEPYWRHCVVVLEQEPFILA